MIEELSKMDFLNVISNNQIIDSQIIRVSAMVKNSDYQRFGINIEDKMKSVLLNEIIVGLVKDITNELFESAEELEEYNVESESSNMVDDLRGDKHIHKVQTDFYNKIFNYLRELNGFKFIMANGKFMSIIMDRIDYKTFTPRINNRINVMGLPNPLGSIDGIILFTDPYMGWSDNRILIGNGKISLEIKENLNWIEFEKIKKLIPKLEEILVEDHIDHIDHSDIDPFGEEDWNPKPTFIEEPYWVSATSRYKISFDKTKFQKIKIIDDNNILS